MTVKTTHAERIKKTSDFWRRTYIRLLLEESRSWDDMTEDERSLDLGGIEDLVEAGYMSGTVTKDSSGIPCQATTRGPTLAGRIFAEEQQDILDKKSLWGRIKSGVGLFVGWLAGIISALIIWRLTYK